MYEKQPTFKQLEYFICLADILNFRQAAAKLGVSQPTLTTQIRSLEETLGITLLERSRNGTFLSPQGKELQEKARHIVESMRDLVDNAQVLAHGPSTTFRLGVPPTVGPYLLPFILPHLHKQYDKLKLYVREDSPRQLEDGLRSGNYDIILSPLPLISSEFSIKTLFREPLKFVVPQDHPLAGRHDVDPQELSGEPVLTLEEHHHFHMQVQNICNQIGANVLRDFEGTSLDTLRQMVVMGMGVAFLPGLYVHSELHRPEALHVCELSNTPIEREHALVWRNGSANRVFFRELTLHFRTIVKEHLSGVVTPLDD
ncbi:hydrogen peroxide-inducible genes activator [Alteromonas sp. a30]|uniref:hydrogen peroxide-inducible genes activator n=1 Tax=Alteromonas sp. a30 TaxID=2730917 RepID=UPI00227E9D8D|nr:hydrogen peroxide-inducible genes activator [Alteromonas sp. a30]MCY7294893.1 hydrogen peroxide-inducible genes activator [Alteromonas sp. a30]